MVHPLKGLVPAMMTPLKTNEDIDPEGIQKLAHFVSRDGINTVFVLGYCGECFTFTREERKQVISLSRDAIAPEKKIIAGIMGNCTREILTYAEDAAEAGADYVLLTPTNFLPLSEGEVTSLLREVADKSPRPIIIYNCPENLQHITADMMGELCHHPNIAGLKQTTDHIDMEFVRRATENEADFTILSGNEYTFLANLALGIEGYIMGGPGNILPQTCVRIMKEFQSGDLLKARKDYWHMTSFLMELYGLPAMAEASLKGILEMKGLCTRVMRRPVRSVDDAHLDKIRALIDKYEIELD